MEHFLGQIGTLEPHTAKAFLKQAIRQAQGSSIEPSERLRHLKDHIASATSEIQSLELLAEPPEDLPTLFWMWLVDFCISKVVDSM